MARSKDDQLRIRISRLTASSAACRRFISTHDKLTGALRIERHIDVIRMGQMMSDMGLAKELAFIDDDIWSKMTQEERLARFFEVIAIKGKAPVIIPAATHTVPPKQSIALLNIPQFAHPEQQATAEEPPAPPAAAAAPAPAEEPATSEPEQPSAAPEPQQVSQLEDGGVVITKKSRAIKAPIKGMGGGA